MDSTKDREASRGPMSDRIRHTYKHLAQKVESPANLVPVGAPRSLPNSESPESRLGYLEIMENRSKMNRRDRSKEHFSSSNFIPEKREYLSNKARAGQIQIVFSTLI